MAKRRGGDATLHVRIDLPVTKSHLTSSSSTICPRTFEKMAKNGLHCVQFGSTSPNSKKGPSLRLRRGVLNRETKSVPERHFCKKAACTSHVQPWLVAIGGWQLVLVGGWWLAVGDKRLVVRDCWVGTVGSGWRVAVGDTWWSQRAARPCTVGANGGSRGGAGAKKRFFPKFLLDHLGCSNKCVWPILSLW